MSFYSETSNGFPSWLLVKLKAFIGCPQPSYSLILRLSFFYFLFCSVTLPSLMFLNLLGTFLPQVLSIWPLAFSTAPFIQMDVTLTFCKPLFKCHILCDIFSDHLIWYCASTPQPLTLSPHHCFTFSIGFIL